MTDHSVLLLAYGQSNAEAYPARPSLRCDAFADPRIVTFDDGHAFRGSLGRVPANRATALVPAAEAASKSSVMRVIQSFQTAAAARLLQKRGEGAPRLVIVRSEARGGRPLRGYVAKGERHVDGIISNADGSDSQILKNLVETMRVSQRLTRERGAPLRRVIVNFLHGEADRGAPGLVYRQHLESLISRVAKEAAALEVTANWLILDPAGTSSSGSGNAWPCRLAMRSVVDARPDVHLIGAGYGYALDDTIHYSSESRALFGEHFGAAAAALLARDAGTDRDLDWLLDAPRPPHAVIKGGSVELHLDGTEDFELIAGISDPALTVEGFSTSIAARCRVTEVIQTGLRSLRVVLNGEPATHDRAALNYAFQILRPDATRTPLPLPAGRGGWRSVKALDSISLPGRRIHQWVPGFSIPFAEMERG